MARFDGLNGPCDERAAWNTVLFFEARKRLWSDASNGSLDAFDIFCECGHDECFGKVSIPVGIFLRAKKQAGFVVVAGHTLQPDEVIEAADGYWIVGKRELSRTAFPERARHFGETADLSLG